VAWLLFRTLVFTLLVPGTVVVLIPRWVVGAQAGLAPPPLLVLGALLLGGGASLVARCFWGFAAEGRGTPAPWDPPRRLVVRGPYRWVRNPIYVGVVGILAGEAALFACWALAAWALTAAVLFHLFVVLYEEPDLRLRFGADYESYLREVPRWLPRLSAARRRS